MFGIPAPLIAKRLKWKAGGFELPDHLGHLTGVREVTDARSASLPVLEGRCRAGLRGRVPIGRPRPPLKPG